MQLQRRHVLLKELLILRNMVMSHNCFLSQYCMYVLKFIQKLKSSIAPKLKTEDEGEVLTVDEINMAKMLWLQEMQKSTVNSQKFSQLKASSRLFADENGLYHCSERLKSVPLPSDSKFPFLIPEEHYVTELIIRNCHNNVMHHGVKDTLTEQLQKCYVCRGRQVVKKFINKCLVCRKLEVKPLPSPPPSDLPEYRLSDDCSFSKCGIDFAGPLFVRDIFSKDATMYKVYIALFTYASSRVLHLDLVPRLHVQPFIRCLRCFFSHGGVTVLFISDNGKTFKTSDLKQFFLKNGVQWKYKFLKFPWWCGRGGGGFIERLVRSTKRCLKKGLGSSKLRYEELLTVLVEVECVLNSKPLTYGHSEEAEEPLTPSHLLLGHRLLSRSAPISSSESLETEEQASRHANILKILFHYFWKRWRSESQGGHSITKHTWGGGLARSSESKPPKYLSKNSNFRKMLKSYPLNILKVVSESSEISNLGEIFIFTEICTPNP